MNWSTGSGDDDRNPKGGIHPFVFSGNKKSLGLRCTYHGFFGRTRVLMVFLVPVTLRKILEYNHISPDKTRRLVRMWKHRLVASRTNFPLFL